MEKINISLKKGQLNAKDNFDFSILKKQDLNLLPIKITKNDSQFEFEIDINEVFPWKDLGKCSTSIKYRSLLNFSKIEHLASVYDFSCNWDNLYFDLNYISKIAFRDIKLYNTQPMDFVKIYKAIIGSTLQSKYSFEDYLNGGISLLSKNKITSNYEKLESVEQIVSMLNKEYDKLQEKLNREVIEVKKSKYINLRIVTIITSVLAVVSITCGVYFGFFKLNEVKNYNTANEKFLQQNYDEVVQSLKKENIGNMNIGTKYILAVSDIKNEKLSSEQKQNILQNIALNSDEKVLEFWDYLAQQNYDSAIEIAKKINNIQYETYAQELKKDSAENNLNLSGEEKDKIIKETEDKIKQNSEKLNFKNE